MKRWSWGSWWALSIVLAGCASAEPEDAKGAESASSSASNESANESTPPLFRGDPSEQAAIVESMVACERFTGPGGFELRTFFPDQFREMDPSTLGPAPCPIGDWACAPPNGRFSVAPVTAASGTSWELRLRREGDPVDAHYATYRIVLGKTTSATGKEVKYVRSLVGEGRNLASDGTCGGD